MITQKQLKTILSYDESTGQFARLKSTTNSHKIHSKVGWLESNGYIRASVNKAKYGCHRLAWLYVYGFMPNQIDHINGVRSDNRISNLRDVTSAENNKNMKLRSDNVSGAYGVNFIKSRNRWQTRITTKGQTKHIGYFPCKQDAILARKKAEEELGFSMRHGA